ncbi:MAG: hypothetical protein SFX73_01075 [Kofleriaceae bacterium]|nr:hypothetical protein [Kofleriaceae bacterium]
MVLRTFALLGVLGACGAPPRPQPPPPPPPPPTCKVDNGWVVLRMRSRCEDMRSGYSGFDVYEVRTGPARGKLVTAHFGDSNNVSIGANWSIGRVEIHPRSPNETGWPNRCGGNSDGWVGDQQAYDDEASATRALAHYCD